MSDELKRYYRRTTSGAVAETEEVRLEFHGANPTSEADLKKSLYLRSAYRHDPSFQNTTIESPADVLDRHAVRRLTDTDQTVPNNYQRIIWRLHGEVDQSRADDRRHHRRGETDFAGFSRTPRSRTLGQRTATGPMSV